MPAILLCGFYGWGSGLFILYYGAKWRLLNDTDNDPMMFSIFVVVVTAIVLGAFAVLKKRFSTKTHSDL
jgi:hypothetical protein